MIAILTYDRANDRIGYTGTNGYLLLWSSGIAGNYESIVSWQVFTKSQAIDTIKLIVMLASII